MKKNFSAKELFSNIITSLMIAVVGDLVIEVLKKLIEMYIS